MTLYEVKTNADRRFFWANSHNQARQMFNRQTGHAKDAHAEVDMVWADNDNAQHRGYVTQ